MKKFLKFCLMSIIIVTLAFITYKVSDKYNLDILKDDIDCTIITKGVENSRAIALDENGIMYIAFDDSIKQIDNDGKEKLIYKDKNLKIEDLAYKDGALYFISDSRLNKFLLSNNTVQVLIDNIPLGGNGIDRKLLITDKESYITIGSVTNSGISEGDNFDRTPIELTLNGINIDGTGAFKGNGIKSEQGEGIKTSPIGNGTVYKISLESGSLELYACGIRGISGIDINSENNIMAIFSGMKDEGIRPVKRDKDYIYELKKNEWYGFPDFSGGDNISSPRFKGDEIIKPLLKTYPKKSPLGPSYQHTSVDSLKELAIDKNGLVFGKDTMVFWDKSENVIGALDKNNVYKKVLKVSNESFVEDIIFNGNEFLILDSGIGCVYNIKAKEGILGFTLPVIVWVFVFLLAFAILMIFVYKMSKKKE